MRKSHRRILVAAALTALASMAILASAATAARPAPPYQDFAGCPSRAETGEVAECLKIEFTGGHVQLGNKEIPISNPFSLHGGLSFFGANWVGNPEAGITPVAQPVPGGLVGLTGNAKLDKSLDTKSLRLSASIELAGTPGNFAGTGLVLPVKVHLENPLLGKTCYVGTNSAPLDLDLVTGTTAPPAPAMPISGQETGPFEREASRPAVETASDGIWVDNTYSTPAASGCTLKLGSQSLDIDKLVDAAYRLPAVPGKDSTVLDFDFSVVSPTVVYP
jgi:hypothetical protein